MSETKKRSSKAAAAATAAAPAGELSPVAAAYDDNNKPLAQAPLVSPLGLAVTRDEQWVGPYEYHVIALILLVALVTRYYGLTDPAGVVRVWWPPARGVALLPAPLLFTDPPSLLVPPPPARRCLTSTTLAAL